jgi:hypothetical protein
MRVVCPALGVVVLNSATRTCSRISCAPTPTAVAAGESGRGRGESGSQRLERVGNDRTERSWSSWSSHSSIATFSTVTVLSASSAAVRVSTPRPTMPSLITSARAARFLRSRSMRPSSDRMIARRCRNSFRRPSKRVSAMACRPPRIRVTGSSDAGASAMSLVADWGISSPPKSTSRLSAKCRKNVRVVRPALAVICGTVVAANPCAANGSMAACSRRSRASGRHLLTSPVWVMTCHVIMM